MRTRKIWATVTAAVLLLSACSSESPEIVARLRDRDRNDNVATERIVAELAASRR